MRYAADADAANTVTHTDDNNREQSDENHVFAHALCVLCWLAW